MDEAALLFFNSSSALFNSSIPYAFLGVSVGAIIAYEVAVLISQHEHFNQPVHLFSICCPNPGVYQRATVRAADMYRRLNRNRTPRQKSIRRQTVITQKSISNLVHRLKPSQQGEIVFSNRISDASGVYSKNGVVSRTYTSPSQDVALSQSSEVDAPGDATSSHRESMMVEASKKNVKPTKMIKGWGMMSLQEVVDIMQHDVKRKQV